MRKIKTVVSIEVDGVMYFRMDSGVCYWTDNLKDAKMYSGKAKAKIAEVKNYILSGNDPNNFNPNNRPRMYLYTQGGFTGFQDKDAIWLKDEYVRTIKLHEVIFDIKPCKV
jgi:hypothetical protein